MPILVKVPVLVQMVVQVPEEINNRWEAGEEDIYHQLEKELTARLNSGSGAIVKVTRVKFIDVGEMNVNLR